jgi:4,5-DOPA dioxygenase extradiol
MSSTPLESVPNGSTRQPVLFMGHGSPMNVIDDNAFRPIWEQMGLFWGEGRRWPSPTAILCISAHWCTEGTVLNALAHPPTVHDFGPAYQVLYDLIYPAPGEPRLAKAWASRFHQASKPNDPLHLGGEDWGFDHGTWGVLRPLFPQAQIPVVQMSLDVRASLSQHASLGAQLKGLRDEGVLIVASGNTVHNLRASVREARDEEAAPWAREFDEFVADRLLAQDPTSLCLEKADSHLREIFRLSHPSAEHYIPLLYAAHAADPDDRVSFYCAQYQWQTVAMRSVLWG